MSRNLARPFFPIPPQEYSARYMNELARAFSVYLDQQANPGLGRFTNVVLTDLPASDSGLEPGTLWNKGGSVAPAGSSLKNPVLTYVSGVVTSIAYDNGSKTLTYNGDGTLNTLATTIGGVTTTKTLSYNADGTLASITET